MSETQLPTDPKYDQYDFPTTAPEAQPGHPGHTTPEHDAKVYQLRTILEQEGYTLRLDTLTLLRFLRARKFDVGLAKDMYVTTNSCHRQGFPPNGAGPPATDATHHRLV